MVSEVGAMASTHTDTMQHLICAEESSVIADV